MNAITIDEHQVGYPEWMSLTTAAILGTLAIGCEEECHGNRIASRHGLSVQSVAKRLNELTEIGWVRPSRQERSYRTQALTFELAGTGANVVRDKMQIFSMTD